MEDLRNLGDKKLILEIARDEKRTKSAAYVRKLYEKKNAMTPCFSHILEQKELDGLSTAGPPDSKEGVLTESWQWEPDGDSVIVEWSIPRDVREEAIAEVATVLRGASVQTPDGDEITDADLPIQ